MGSELAPLAGRLIFGTYFVFSGLNHFMRTENLAGWLDTKGVPQPELLTYFTGGQLILVGAQEAVFTAPLV